MTAVSGILPLDKPTGPTSHDVVALTRKALDIRRVGHTGTLDPFASGLLLVCVGPATRLAEYLSPQEKGYVATARLGVATTTHDLEGDVVARSEAWGDLTRERVAAALRELRGTILQRPPVFSAKKVAGESAHRRARRGEVVELASVEVTVHEIELTAFDLPRIDFRVRCSSGTYIRALARDLGDILGVGAHLEALRRTAIGSFTVEGALAVDDLDDPAKVRAARISPARAVGGFSALRVDAEEARRLSQGQFLTLETEWPGSSDEPVAVLLDEELVAVGFVEDGQLRPKKVFGGG